MGLAEFDLAIALRAQRTANPITTNKPLELPDARETTDPLKQPNNRTHIKWIYQWGMRD